MGAPLVFGAPWDVADAPPWDGTGIPFPVDENGWPVIPVTDSPVTFEEVTPGAAVDLSKTVKYKAIYEEANATNPTNPAIWHKPEGGTWASTGIQRDNSSGGTTTCTHKFDPTPAELGFLPGTTLNEISVYSYGVAGPTLQVAVAAAAVVLDLDGNPVPTDEDGLPILTVADEGFEPADHTVAEVTAYLDENPDQADYVLDRERAGKARTTLIGETP